MWVRFEPRAMDHGWWPGVVGDLLPLLFLIALLAFGIWAVHRITEQDRRLAVGAGAGMPPVDGALDELRLRYARGELDRDGYVQRLHDLGGEEPEPTPPSPPAPPDAA
jgi:putative membrane protein